MTEKHYYTYWCSNHDWWDYDENGNPVVLDTAPQKAKKSYQRYLKYEKRYGRLPELEPDYAYREHDVDVEKIEEIYAEKTIEELDAKFERFKQQFLAEHPEQKKENEQNP